MRLVLYVLRVCHLFSELGTIKVSDYINAAKKGETAPSACQHLNCRILMLDFLCGDVICVVTVCRSKSVGPEKDPFFCVDLVYISVLLQKLGFSPQQQFKVRNARVWSWARSRAWLRLIRT